MAEFCRDCAEDMFGDGNLNDFNFLCAKGETLVVLCEGCGGYIEVDYYGKKVRMLKKVV